MTCPRCGHRMKEMRGTHHKRKKWICRNCGKIRFTTPKKKGK